MEMNKNEECFLATGLMHTAPPGQYKVVDLFNVESETLRGWRLVCLMQTSACVSVTRAVVPGSVPPPALSQYNSYNGGTQVTYVDQQLATVTKALLRLDESSALARAAGDAERLIQDTNLLRTEHTKVCSSVKTLTSELEAAKAQANTAAVSLKSSDANVGRLAASVNKLESDLAKVREAIGGLALKKILEGTPA